MAWVTSWVARCMVYAILVGVACVSHVMSGLRRLLLGGRQSQHVNNKSLILLGTFYNLGWFRSHILPLAKSKALDEIIVICDGPLIDAPKVLYCHPPSWLRLLGRTPARFIWALWEAQKRKPGTWMGYHVMPNALFALVGARIFGARAIYQMTGGPIQLMGGGNGSENVLLRKLRRPSRWLEALLFHVVRQFDCVVVRGGSAKTFVEDHRLCDRCEIITGSVDVSRFAPNSITPQFDIVCVARLVSYKGVDALLTILALVAKSRPSVRAAIVGGGPLRERLVARCTTLGISHCVEFLGQVDDVERVLQRTKLFVLASPSEGMSIAMIEAMAAGLPAIVNDVGDLRDIVESGCNGVLLDPSDHGAAAARIVELLEDDTLRMRMSKAARSTVMDRCSVDAVAKRWDTLLSFWDEHESRTTAPKERETRSLGRVT